MILKKGLKSFLKGSEFGCIIKNKNETIRVSEIHVYSGFPVKLFGQLENWQICDIRGILQMKLD